MAGSFHFDVNQPRAPQAPASRGPRAAQSDNENKPAAFRAWVTTRILGEAFRSALTNGPKKRLESPFSKYLGEARDSLSKLRNLGLPKEPPAPDFKLPPRPLTRFDAKVERSKNQLDNLVPLGLQEKPVPASPKDFSPSLPVHPEKPKHPVLQDFHTLASQKNESIRPLERATDLKTTPLSPLKPQDPGEAGVQAPRPERVPPKAPIAPLRPSAPHGSNGGSDVAAKVPSPSPGAPPPAKPEIEIAAKVQTPSPPILPGAPHGSTAKFEVTAGVHLATPASQPSKPGVDRAPEAPIPSAPIAAQTRENLTVKPASAAPPKVSQSGPSAQNPVATDASFKAFSEGGLSKRIGDGFGGFQPSSKTGPFQAPGASLDPANLNKALGGFQPTLPGDAFRGLTSGSGLLEKAVTSAGFKPFAENGISKLIGDGFKPPSGPFQAPAASLGPANLNKALGGFQPPLPGDAFQGLTSGSGLLEKAATAVTSAGFKPFAENGISKLIGGGFKPPSGPFQAPAASLGPANLNKALGGFQPPLPGDAFQGLTSGSGLLEKAVTAVTSAGFKPFAENGISKLIGDGFKPPSNAPLGPGGDAGLGGFQSANHTDALRGFISNFGPGSFDPGFGGFQPPATTLSGGLGSGLGSGTFDKGYGGFQPTAPDAFAGIAFKGFTQGGLSKLLEGGLGGAAAGIFDKGFGGFQPTSTTASGGLESRLGSGTFDKGYGGFQPTSHSNPFQGLSLGLGSGILDKGYGGFQPPTTTDPFTGLGFKSFTQGGLSKLLEGGLGGAAAGIFDKGFGGFQPTCTTASGGLESRLGSGTFDKGYGGFQPTGHADPFQGLGLGLGSGVLDKGFGGFQPTTTPDPFAGLGFKGFTQGGLSKLLEGGLGGAAAGIFDKGFAGFQPTSTTPFGGLESRLGSGTFDKGYGGFQPTSHTEPFQGLGLGLGSGILDKGYGGFQPTAPDAFAGIAFKGFTQGGLSKLLEGGLGGAAAGIFDKGFGGFQPTSTTASGGLESRLGSGTFDKGYGGFQPTSHSNPFQGLGLGLGSGILDKGFGGFQPTSHSDPFLGLGLGLGSGILDKGYGGFQPTTTTDPFTGLGFKSFTQGGLSKLLEGGLGGAAAGIFDKGFGGFQPPTNANPLANIHAFRSAPEGGYAKIFEEMGLLKPASPAAPNPGPTNPPLPPIANPNAGALSFRPSPGVSQGSSVESASKPAPSAHLPSAGREAVAPPAEARPEVMPPKRNQPREMPARSEQTTAQRLVDILPPIQVNKAPAAAKPAEENLAALEPARAPLASPIDPSPLAPAAPAQPVSATPIPPAPPTPGVATPQSAEMRERLEEPFPLAPTKIPPAVARPNDESRPAAPAKKAEPKGENLVTPGRNVEGIRHVAPVGPVEPVSLEESRRNDAQPYSAPLEKRLDKPHTPVTQPQAAPTPARAQAESGDNQTEVAKPKKLATPASTTAQTQTAQAASEKAADAENAKAAAREANLRQASTSSAALQQGLAQQQNEADKTRHQSEPESKSSRTIEDKSESTGGAAKSGRATESEQARRQMQQQQRTQQNSTKASQPGSSSSKTRYVTKPQEPEDADDIATSDQTTMKSCDKCGFALGGAADLACPVCSTEQPDLALRLFTQYRQMGTHWITFADTLAVTDGAREVLAESETTPVQLQFVPRIPKFSQVLRLKQQP